MHFFVAQLRLAENFRLQLELHEFLYSFSLHEHLWSLLVNRHTQFVLLSEENRPFLRRKLEAEFIEQSPQLCDLFLRERVRVGIQRPTLNAQCSTLNRFVIPSGVDNGAAGKAATWTRRPQAERTEVSESNVWNI